jgi:hypothetical protein
MRSLTRAAAVVAPLVAASVLAFAGPAAADGTCQWGGLTAAAGGTVVANGLQFSCHNNGAGTAPSWQLDGRSSAPTTPDIQADYHDGDNPGDFSDGATLWGAGGEAIQSYGDFWNDGGSFVDVYDSAGWIDDGGGGGGFGGLMP